MAHKPFYPASTIGNYVWALCAFMEQELQADPRENVIGWSFFMTAVKVLTFVPYEPRTRLPTASSCESTNEGDADVGGQERADVASATFDSHSVTQRI